MKLEVSDKCVGCGACAADCPVGVLAMSDGRPVARAYRAAHCINGQHCLTVCCRDGARVEMI